MIDRAAAGAYQYHWLCFDVGAPGIPRSRLVLVNKLLQLFFADPVFPADLQGLDLFPGDHVADGLCLHLEDLGDLIRRVKSGCRGHYPASVYGHIHSLNLPPGA